MAAKKQTYEENIEQIDEILEKLENEELSLDDSIEEYEKAIKLIKDSEKLLEIGEGKVLKVLEKNGKIEENVKGGRLWDFLMNWERRFPMQVRT